MRGKIFIKINTGVFEKGRKDAAGEELKYTSDLFLGCFFFFIVGNELLV